MYYVSETRETYHVVESNAVLKLKFQKLHLTVADNVNAANIVDFLFQEGVVGHQDVSALKRGNDPPQQCRDLLMLLHASQHPDAFTQLYRALRNEPSLRWLVDCVDEFGGQPLINALHDRYLREPAGKCET